MSAPHATQAAPEAQPADQAQLPIFRVLLVLVLPVAAIFGALPYASPDLFAAITGYTGDEPFVYRLAGAATLGYGAAAAYGLRRLQWRRHRIATVATLAFNATAALGAAITLVGGDVRPVSVFIAVAASVFSVITLYWLVRDEGPALDDQRPVDGWFRAVLAAATAAAALFGLAALLAPEPVANAAGFATTDLFIYRLAGAATLGYAAAGVVQIRARRAAEIQLQVIAAFVFNALSVVAAVIYVAGGGRSFIAWVIAAAALAFSICAAAWLARSPTNRTEEEVAQT